VNLDEVKSSQVRDHKTNQKNAAAPSTAVSTVEKKTGGAGGNLLELDLLGDDGDTNPVPIQSQGQNGVASTGNIDFLGLDSSPQPTPQNIAQTSANMMDLLGDEDILSPSPVQFSHQTQASLSHIQPHDPLGGFDLSGMISPNQHNNQTTHNAMGGDGLDLLGGGVSSNNTTQNVERPTQQGGESDLFGLDLLGGSSHGTSSPRLSQKSLNFIGFEDNNLIVKCSCSKVVYFNSRQTITQ
jgi:hypothetical protein